MEAVKTHQGKTYAFDATAQGKGLWKQVTKAGKLGKIASKDLQQRWGNPNDSGPLYNQSSQIESDQSNVMKFGGMIKEKTPTPERLKTFRRMLTDPNETVGSAAVKGIKQRLRPEILVKNLFGKTAGLMAAKGLGVSSERMEAVDKGFSDAPTGFTGKVKGGSAEAPKEIGKELKLIRMTSQQTYNQIKEINDYFKAKAKKEDIEGDKRALPTKPMSSSTGGAAAAAPAAAPAAAGGGFLDSISGAYRKSKRRISRSTKGTFDSIKSKFGGAGGGFLDSIKSMFGGARGFSLAGARGFSLAAIGTTIFSVLTKVLKKAVTKIPIVGPLILAAFGLKDAYDEHVKSGDFGSAVGAFFESVAGTLTFGLSTSLLGEGGIKNFVKGIVDDTTEMFKKFFDSAIEWLDEYIITPAGEMWEKIKTAIGEFSLSETITTISEKISSAFESIKSWFSENIITPASNMWEKIKESIPEFSVSEIIDTLKTKFGNAVTNVKDFITGNLIDPIISIPGKIVGTLKSIVASLFEKIANFELKLPEFTLKNPVTKTEYKLGGQSFKPFAGLLPGFVKEEDKGPPPGGGGGGGSPPQGGSVNVEDKGPPPGEGGGGGGGGGSPPQGGSVNVEEVEKEALKNLKDAQDQTKSYEMEDTSLGSDLTEEQLDRIFGPRRTNVPSTEPAEPQPVTAVPIQPVPAGTDLRNLPPTGLPVPQPRATGQVIQQSAEQLAATQNNAQTPAQPIIVNNTTNNSSGGGGGSQSQPTASLRNDEPTILRVQMENAIMAY